MVKFGFDKKSKKRFAMQALRDLMITHILNETG